MAPPSSTPQMRQCSGLGHAYSPARQEAGAKTLEPCLDEDSCHRGGWGRAGAVAWAALAFLLGGGSASCLLWVHATPAFPATFPWPRAAAGASQLEAPVSAKLATAEKANSYLMRRNAALLEQVEALTSAQGAWEEERRTLRNASVELARAARAREAEMARLETEERLTRRVDAREGQAKNATADKATELEAAQEARAQLQVKNGALAKQVFVLNGTKSKLHSRINKLQAEVAEEKYEEAQGHDEAHELEVTVSSLSRNLLKAERRAARSPEWLAPPRRERAPAGKSWAFVTMAYDKPGHPQDHLLQAIPVARALQRLSAFPLLVLTDASSFADASPVAERLRRLGAEVLPLSRVDPPAGLSGAWTVAHWKLQAWTLTSFERLVWIDADSILYRSLDWLFERPWMWAQRDDTRCEMNVARASTGVLLLYPNVSDYRGLLLQASSGAPEASGGVDSLVASYFRDVRRRPVQLLSEVEAAFGQCLGKAQSPYINMDGRPVGGSWSMPNFVHKSGGWGVRTRRYENVCFSHNLSRQQYYVGESVLNACQWHPLGAYWRGLFCEATAIAGLELPWAKVFCDDACYYRGAGGSCPVLPVNATTTYEEYYAKTKGMPFLEFMK